MNILLTYDKLYCLPIIKSILPEQIQVDNPLAELAMQAQLQAESDKSEQQFESPYQFEIESYQTYEDIVVYFIIARDIQTKTKWRFKARYSDLRDIHLALKAKRFKELIPEFPKRKIFGITNENPNDIEMRKNNLQKYLNQVFRYHIFSIFK